MMKIKAIITAFFKLYSVTAIHAAPPKLNLNIGNQSFDGSITANKGAGNNSAIGGPSPPIVIVNDVPAPPPPPPPPPPFFTVVGYSPPACSTHISGWVAVGYNSLYQCTVYGVSYSCAPTYAEYCTSQPIYECN